MRELWIRILTAVVGIPIFVWIVWTGGWLWFVAVELLILGSSLELVALFRKMDIRIASFPVLAWNLFLPLLFFPELSITDHSLELLAFFLSGSVILSATFVLYRSHRNAALAVAGSAFSVLYVGLSLSLLLALRFVFELSDAAMLAMIGSPDRAGAKLIIALFATIWISDSAAYFAGRQWGKRKLAPAVSPKKTWEGAIAGFIGGILAFGIAGSLLLPALPRYHWIVLGAVVGVIGPIGDLTESLLKRKAGVKDSSQFFPGHGGFLDRFDSALFCAPATFGYVWFFLR